MAQQQILANLSQAKPVPQLFYVYKLSKEDAKEILRRNDNDLTLLALRHAPEPCGALDKSLVGEAVKRSQDEAVQSKCMTRSNTVLLSEFTPQPPLEAIKPNVSARERRRRRCNKNLLICYMIGFFYLSLTSRSTCFFNPLIKSLRSPW